MRENTALEINFVKSKTSNMLIGISVKINMNDTTISTNFGGAKLYDKNNIHTKLRNLQSRNVLGLGAHINCNYIQIRCMFLPMEIEA